MKPAASRASDAGRRRDGGAQGQAERDRRQHGERDHDEGGGGAQGVAEDAGTDGASAEAPIASV